MWSTGRGRSVRKEITFTSKEWEDARALHKKCTEGLPNYARYGDFARAMLTQGEVKVTVKRPLVDSVPIAKAIDRIGVNVNTIAHYANTNRTISADQVAEVRDGFTQIEATLNRIFDAEDAAPEERE